jgi:hypothetical protein
MMHKIFNIKICQIYLPYYATDYIIIHKISTLTIYTIISNIIILCLTLEKLRYTFTPSYPDTVMAQSPWLRSRPVSHPKGPWPLRSVCRVCSTKQYANSLLPPAQSFQTCTMGSMACRSMSADHGEEVI